MSVKPAATAPLIFGEEARITRSVLGDVTVMLVAPFGAPVIETLMAFPLCAAVGVNVDAIAPLTGAPSARH